MQEGGPTNSPQRPTKPDFSINDIAPPSSSAGDSSSAQVPSTATKETEILKPGLSANAPSSKPKKNKNSLMTLGLSALVIIVFIGGLYYVYSWQHKKVDNLTTQVSGLNSQGQTDQQQINKYKSELASANSTKTSSNTTSQAQVNSQYLFKISQLGVELTLPATLADITYQANSSNTSVNLSTTNLNDLDSGCVDNTTKGSALGDISKVSGQFTAKTGTTLIKQYTSDYIVYTAPTSTCSNVTQVNSLVTTLETALKTSFSTIQETSS